MIDDEGSMADRTTPRPKDLIGEDYYPTLLTAVLWEQGKTVTISKESWLMALELARGLEVQERDDGSLILRLDDLDNGDSDECIRSTRRG